MGSIGIHSSVKFVTPHKFWWESLLINQISTSLQKNLLICINFFLIQTSNVNIKINDCNSANHDAKYHYIIMNYNYIYKYVIIILERFFHFLIFFYIFMNVIIEF